MLILISCSIKSNVFIVQAFYQFLLGSIEQAYLAQTYLNFVSILPFFAID